MWYRLLAAAQRSLSPMRCRSKKLRIWLLPPSNMARTCSCDQESMRMERTKEVLTPNERCLPLHRMQMSVPYVTLAHSGLASPQSQQRLLPGSETISLRQLRGKWVPLCWQTVRRDSNSDAACAIREGAACSIVVEEICFFNNLEPCVRRMSNSTNSSSNGVFVAPRNVVRGVDVG